MTNEHEQTGMVPARGSSAVVREDRMGATELVHDREANTTALAAQAKASVEARYVMALQRPRNIDRVRVRLLDDCKRRGFAEQARYRLPVGGSTITGASIRFAEAAVRHLGNLWIEAPVLYEDEDKRIVRVVVTDLEANAAFSEDIVIEKTVERSKVRDGQVVIGSRTNSQGKTTYIVRATENDLRMKEGSAKSKAIRNAVLRLLPGDIFDEAMWTVGQTLQAEDARDPKAARRKIVDAFHELGIDPDAINAYLGHDLGGASPAELDELRGAYAAVKDGQTTWAELLEVKRGEPEKPSGGKPSGRAAKAREQLREKAAQRGKPTTHGEAYDPETGEFPDEPSNVQADEGGAKP